MNASTIAIPPPDVDLRSQYAGGVIAMTVIAVLIALLRMYVRIFVIRSTWWDDWIMLAAVPITIITNAFLIQAYYLGLGRHIAYVPPAQIPTTFQFLWMAEPTNLFALYTVRLSISFSFLRIVPKSNKVFRRWIWSTIIGLSLSDIYVSVIYFAECIPIQKVWLPDTPGWCITGAAYQAGPWTYQAVSIITDAIIIILAIRLFATLQVPLKTKIALTALTTLGIFTLICAAVKTALLVNLFSPDLDKTWSLAQLCLWAPLEICVGMICGCLPCLKPLFDRVFKIATGRTTRGTVGTGSRPDTNWPLSTVDKSDTKIRYQSMRLGSDTSLHALKDNPQHGDKDIYKSTRIEWSSDPSISTGSELPSHNPAS